jgi:hypothetical protein
MGMYIVFTVSRISISDIQVLFPVRSTKHTLFQTIIVTSLLPFHLSISFKGCTFLYSIIYIFNIPAHMHINPR